MAPTNSGPSRIFHIAFESDWSAAQVEGSYRVSTRGLTLGEVGFIHAGFEHQVSTIGTAFYADVTDPVVVLVVDTERLDVPVVVESPKGSEEAFPHIYGALPIHAVVEVLPASITDGVFVVEDLGPS